jgi:endogenous inhibitor of DNA gyrase (YacG/DUF329 family)
LAVGGRIPTRAKSYVALVARSKSQPTRKVVDGVEYFSVAAAAEALGRDKRTVTRLEKAGIVPRPEHVLPGDPRQRWYSAADLEMLRRVSDATGFRTSKNRGKEFLAALTAEKRRRQEVGEKPARPWRLLVDRFSQDEVREKVRRWDDIEGAPAGSEKAAPKPAEPSLCPTCGRELLWRTERNPGGHTEQVPWCERCGFVDLREPPPPDPNACPRCGREVIWTLQDPLPGFQPMCERCGAVEVAHGPKTDPMQEQPFRREANLAGMPPVETGRPRGLTQRDVVGAVRVSRPPAGRPIVFIDPPPMPVRPS